MGEGGRAVRSLVGPRWHDAGGGRAGGSHQNPSCHLGQTPLRKPYGHHGRKRVKAEVEEKT